MTLSQNTPLKTAILAILSLFIFTNLSFAQSKVEQIDELVNQYHQYGKFNGSILVADQGKVIFKKGFGMANMEWDIPNEPNTKHRLGSITKQFTGMLVLQFAEADKIDLHAPITMYLPDYPKENGDRITVHHLLTHSSGIPNYTAFPAFFAEDSRDHFTPDEFVGKFSDKELEFSPGEKFNYSNSGYFLLGVIIEKLSGKSYEQMLHDKIFTPAGMNDTGYDNHEDILKNRATGYEKDGNGFINSHYLDMSIPYAAGSMYSTVEDLYLWDQALYSEKLLSQKYMDMYFKPYISAFGDFNYAYGWTVGKDVIGNTTDSLDVISHGGGINGFNTYISRTVSDKSLVVALNNTGGAPIESMTRAINGILYGVTYDLPKKSLTQGFMTVIQSKGIEEGITYFEANKDSDEMELDEREMNSLGYQFMAEEKTKEASQVFKLNMEAFPKSSNVYDSYAESLMALGENDAAIKNYTIAVEMNPSNQHGIDMLEELGVDTSNLIKEVIVAEDILESYIGRYELAPTFIITITKDGQQLYAQATNQPTLTLMPKSDDAFYVKEVEAQLVFTKDENMNVESLTLLQGGREMVGKRLVD